jgi:imidazolonepropionase-like amidohydrolase
MAVIEEGGKSLEGFFDSWLRDVATTATDLVVTNEGILRAALPREEPEAYGRTAIYAGTLVYGTGADPTRHKVVVCEKGRIAEIVDAKTFRPAPDTYIIDASAKTVLPGLIDVEVCLFGDGSGTPPATREEWEARYRQNARTVLSNGVTTVRDVYGGISRVDCPEAGLSVDGLRLREALRGHPAPRILATGPPIGARESTYFPLIRISSPEEATDAVSRALEEGANLIYFFASNIDLGDNPPNLSQDTMKALVAAGHKRGLRVTAESIGLEANRAAVAAGVDCLKHGVYVDDALVSEMRERGTYYVPTLAIIHHYLESAKGGQQRTKVEAVVRAAEDSLRRALKGGVRVVAGSDSGGKGCRHGTMLQEELQLLVAAGMSPREAIRAATARAAECLGLANDIGAISVGKAADILVVDQNPLSNLSTLSSPNLVIQGGKIVFRRSPETR